MERVRIKKIKRIKYTGPVYNLELEGIETNNDDLYWVEQNSGLVIHNCLPKDMDHIINIAKDPILLKSVRDVNIKMGKKL